MIVEEKFQEIGAVNVYDPDKRCRYSIIRTWEPKRDRAAIIMSNPRVYNPNPFIPGKSLGHCYEALVAMNNIGSFEVVNLFANISDSQVQLAKEHRIVDELNLGYIRDAVLNADVVVLAWGNKGFPVSKDRKFKELFVGTSKKLYCFGVLKTKQPRYPNYLSKEDKLVPCFMDVRGNVYLFT